LSFEKEERQFSSFLFLCKATIIFASSAIRFVFRMRRRNKVRRKNIKEISQRLNWRDGRAYKEHPLCYIGWSGSSRRHLVYSYFIWNIRMLWKVFAPKWKRVTCDLELRLLQVA
jgi:hypothetical protein